MTDDRPARRTRGPLEIWLDRVFRYSFRGLALIFVVAALGMWVAGTFVILGLGPARGPAAILFAVMLWSWALAAGSGAIRGWIMGGPHSDDMRKPWEWIISRAIFAFLLAGGILLIFGRFAV